MTLKLFRVMKIHRYIYNWSIEGSLIHIDCKINLLFFPKNIKTTFY